MSLTTASLVVASALVALAAAAWIKLWAQPEEDGGPVGAHLPALAQWALGVLALHGLCLIVAGDARLGSWALAAGFAFAAAVLQYPPAARELEPDEDDVPGSAPAPQPGHAELWAGQPDDATRTGLWRE
jgi:hypothetical protein